MAVAIGTAHGIYPSDMKPELRLDILQTLKDTLDIPLVLHGGSSNKDEEIAKAVKIGISKINISSDIKVAFYDKCREVLNAHPEYREPLEIYPEPIKACREVIAHKKLTYLILQTKLNITERIKYLQISEATYLILQTNNIKRGQLRLSPFRLYRRERKS